MIWRDAIARELDEEIADVRGLGGGCIADTSLVTLDSGRRIVVKTMAGKPDMFRKEAFALRELARARAIRVPDVLAAGETFIALEYIEAGQQRPGFQETFGRQFARLHRFHADHFGFPEDNYCGSTVQPNTPTVPAEQGWAGFYWEYRLLFQLRLAERSGRADDRMIRLFGALENRIDHLLAGTEEPPSLLHGDLWSGNYMVTADGEPCLIDPAAYYGHREADLGMTYLFGDFGRAFYAAYDDEFPLPPGHEERIGLYELYHVMNHLNIFGASYYGQAIAILRRYA